MMMVSRDSNAWMIHVFVVEGISDILSLLLSSLSIFQIPYSNRKAALNYFVYVYVLKQISKTHFEIPVLVLFSTFRPYTFILKHYIFVLLLYFPHFVFVLLF